MMFNHSWLLELLAVRSPCTASSSALRRFRVGNVRFSRECAAQPTRHWPADRSAARDQTALNPSSGPFAKKVEREILSPFQS